MIGAATGTKSIPNYAEIFMAGLKENLFKQLKSMTYIWLQYLDDRYLLHMDKRIGQIA